MQAHIMYIAKLAAKNKTLQRRNNLYQKNFLFWKILMK